MVAWSLAIHGTKIHSPDPPLPAVCAAYATEPLLSVLHPPIKLPSFGPRGRIHLDRRVDFPTICFAALARIEIHI